MGLFTKPHVILDPDLFNSHNMLLKSVRQNVLDWIYSIIPKSEIDSIVLLGSSVGYTWEPTSDMDINIILSKDSKGIVYWFPLTRKTNGKLLKNTLHPMNLFPEDFVVPDWSNTIFGAYDIINNRWIMPTVPPKDLPDVQTDYRPDLIFANLQEDQIKRNVNNLIHDYQFWKASNNDDWLVEVQNSLESLSETFFQLDQGRKMAYQMGWGVPRYSSQNIIFKYIEKHKFLDILQTIYHHLRDNYGFLANTEI